MCVWQHEALIRWLREPSRETLCTPCAQRSVAPSPRTPIMAPPTAPPPHLDLREPKLRALRHEPAVDGDARAAVVVEAPAVAAPLVRVQVHAARLGGRRGDQLEARVELAQLVVAAAAVGDDLDAGEREVDVRRARREELLARLGGEQRVAQPQRAVAERRGALAGQVCERRRQREVLERPAVLPGGEVALLSVVVEGGSVLRVVVAVVLVWSAECLLWFLPGCRPSSFSLPTITVTTTANLTTSTTTTTTMTPAAIQQPRPARTASRGSCRRWRGAASGARAAPSCRAAARGSCTRRRGAPPARRRRRAGRRCGRCARAPVGVGWCVSVG